MVKFLAGVLVGVLLTVGAYWVRDTKARLDNIENYLTTHPIPQMQLEMQSEHMRASYREAR